MKSLESGDFEALRDLVHEGVNVDAVCEGKFGKAKRAGSFRF